MIDFSSAQKIAATHGWLMHTPAPFRDAVLKRSRLQAFEAGDTIYSVGDPPGGLYGLISGSLGISIAPGERGPYLVHLGRPGTWFGEGCAITGMPRRIGLKAVRPCQMLHLSLRAFQEIVQADPTAWRFIALLTSMHLETAMGGADDLMIRDHVQRIIAILLRLGGCRNKTPEGAAPIEYHLSQDDLAIMANVARTTAGAVLRQLEKDEFIRRAYRQICVLAPDSMRALLPQQ